MNLYFVIQYGLFQACETGPTTEYMLYVEKCPRLNYSEPTRLPACKWELPFSAFRKLLPADVILLLDSLRMHASCVYAKSLELTFFRSIGWRLQARKRCETFCCMGIVFQSIFCWISYNLHTFACLFPVGKIELKQHNSTTTVVLFKKCISITAHFLYVAIKK